MSNERSMIARRRALPKKRSLQKVPFVELYGGRVQGVVSSGSDIARVYVSFFQSGSGDFYCSTNNNRPCGGLRGSPCKHLVSLLENAVAQYGAERVSRYLALEEEARDARRILGLLRGSMKREPAGQVFSRFL